ncbi:ankyrin repeat domain-containing protein [Bacillus wiedmannii]|uniref:ankyrin repeat domain-containing protein n=1 Tax=Bacillus wiedmannii TaxID=1890302 RepID=UPI00019FE0BF|nr:ankyrin repeat domain-containing protein [Bacillus wiedmannii]EEK66853.1 Ankyrin [Bacillus wiedmannii]MCC2380311.1 ankyrin repeat domain-containing protein [Bacillus wiedmannii]MCC2424307.1 ankyrin repeat domain-containing protein [Bacillus wiedmannii]
MDKIQFAKRIRDSIKSGQLNTLKDLLEREPKMLEHVTPFGTWLHVATAYGNLEIIEHLIHSGIDIHAKCGTFSTNALERAATKGHFHIAEYFIKHQVEMDTSEPDRNPLFAAIYSGHFEIVKLLVMNGIDITIKYSGNNMKEMDAYTFAVERGEMEIAEYVKRKLNENIYS